MFRAISIASLTNISELDNFLRHHFFLHLTLPLFLLVKRKTHQPLYLRVVYICWPVLEQFHYLHNLKSQLTGLFGCFCISSPPDLACPRLGYIFEWNGLKQLFSLPCIQIACLFIFFCDDVFCHPFPVDCIEEFYFWFVSRRFGSE